jgi:DNA-binding NarL/FixJ family response regulator
VPDLLILDLWMGGNDGFELLKQIRAGWPEILILAYSMNDERIFGRRVLQAGAAGYLMKSHGLDELLKALRIVAEGDRYLSAALAAELAGDALRSTSDPAKPAALAALTDRELQVLRLIGAGHTTASIAAALQISPKTVGAHREHLKDKLGLADGAALSRHAAVLVETRVL